ncbi:MAG: glycerophosphodiester phosphodiesterase family protein [Pseudomonadota bacterium]
MSPRLVCHRGASVVAPENTFAAAEAAVRGGGHVVELDVRESADGVLYVLHDKTLDRTTDGTGPIHLLQSSEIDALDAGRWFSPEFEGQRVPRLDAYLDVLRALGAGAYVEIKWCDPTRAADLIRESGIADEVFTFSFKPEMRDGMRRAAPDIRQVILLSLARNASVASSLYGADILELETEELSAATVEAARRLGLEVMGYYEGTDPSVFQKMFDLDIDYINHDHLEITAAMTSDPAV